MLNLFIGFITGAFFGMFLTCIAVMGSEWRHK